MRRRRTTTRVDINQLGLGGTIGDPEKFIAFLGRRGIGREEELTGKISKVVNILEAGNLADHTGLGIQRVERPVGASIIVVVRAEIEAAIGIHQPVDGRFIATGEPRHGEPLGSSRGRIDAVKPAPQGTIGGREVENAVDIQQAPRAGIKGDVVDVAGEAGTGLGAIGLPQLGAVEAVIGHEIQAAAGGEEGTGIGTAATGPDVAHRHGIEAGIEAEEFPAEAGTLSREVQHTTSLHQLLHIGGAATGIDVNQLGLNGAIGNAE